MAKGAGPLLLLGGLGAAFLLTRKKKDAAPENGGMPLPDIGEDTDTPDFAMFEEYGFAGPGEAREAMILLGFESLEHMGQYMGESVSGQFDEQILEWLRNGMDMYHGGAWEPPPPMGA